MLLNVQAAGLLHETKINFLELVIEKYEREIDLLHSQIRLYDFHDPQDFLQNLPSPSHKEIVLPSDFQIQDDHVFNANSEELFAGLIVEDFAVSSPETLPHIYIPTPSKVSFHPHVVISPNSSSISQNTLSTPSSTTRTPTIISTPPLVQSLPAISFIPVNMNQEGPEKNIPHDAFVDPVADYIEDFLNSKSVTCFLCEDQIYQQWPFSVTILIMGAHDQIMLPISLTISQPVHFFL